MMAKLEIKKLRRWSPIKGRAERQKARNKRIDIKDLGHVILFLAAFLGVWHIVFIFGIFPKVSLPSPAMVAQSFADLLFDGSLVMSIGMTMWRLVAGFSISIILGVGTGLLMVRFRDFGKTMSSFAVGLQSFPSIAWVPFPTNRITNGTHAILGNDCKPTANELIVLQSFPSIAWVP